MKIAPWSRPRPALKRPRVLHRVSRLEWLERWIAADGFGTLCVALTSSFVGAQGHASGLLATSNSTDLYGVTPHARDEIVAALGAASPDCPRMFDRDGK
jgi:hypothetical protein